MLVRAVTLVCGKIMEQLIPRQLELQEKEMWEMTSWSVCPLPGILLSLHKPARSLSAPVFWCPSRLRGINNIVASLSYRYSELLTATYGPQKISKRNGPYYRRRWLFWFPVSTLIKQRPWNYFIGSCWKKLQLSTLTWIQCRLLLVWMVLNQKWTRLPTAQTLKFRTTDIFYFKKNSL